ncbi:hypothetical protein Tco_0231531, partial [Tanacetum coccineum]
MKGDILFKVDFDPGFEGLKLSSFARVLRSIKVLEVIKFESSKQVGLKQLGSKQVRFKQLGHKQVGFKQLGPGVITGVHRVQGEKHVWFEVELKGAQGDREPEVFQEQENVHLGIKVGAYITITEVPGQEGNVAGRKKRRSKEAKPGNLLKFKFLEAHVSSTKAIEKETPCPSKRASMKNIISTL